MIILQEYIDTIFRIFILGGFSSLGRKLGTKYTIPETASNPKAVLVISIVVLHVVRL